MPDALVGYSGFVGTTLTKQHKFDFLYRSSNINDIKNRKFDTVVCAGAPAQKWIANKDPQTDRDTIQKLIDNLSTIKCEKMILISTVDVFDSAVDVDENSPVPEDGLQPYGLNRRYLEKFVKTQFSDSLIVRLPGLVGPGLRKNIIYDLLNDNNISAIDSRGVFQFYPMVNLWADIDIALRNDLKLVHLTAQPISVEEVSTLGFLREFSQQVLDSPAVYDMQSIHASMFGGEGKYQYSKRDTVQAIRNFVQSEPKDF